MALRSKNIGVGLFALLLALAAVVTQLHSYHSPDNSWLLYATQRYLNGEVLYRDLLETNPPLIVWLYSVPVKLAGLMHISVDLSFALCVVALILVSLELAIRLLRENSTFNQPERFVMWGALALPLLSCAPFVFGQREQLWLVLMLPYLCQSLMQRVDAPMTPRQMLIALMAAVGFALKPFFAVVWVANELFLAWWQKNPHWLVRPTNLVIAATGIAYIAATYALYPDYFTLILPMVAEGYRYYKTSPGEVLEATAMVSVFYLTPILLLKPVARFKPLKWQLVVFYIAVCSVHMLQQKGWYNHYYPMFVAGSLVSAAVVMQVLIPWVREKREPGLMNFGLLFMSLIGLFAMPVIEPVRLPARVGSDVVVEALRRDIHTHAAGKNVMVFSFNLKAAFPLMNGADGFYPSRFHHLWMLPVVAAEPDGQHQKTKDYVIANIRDEFKKYLPALVWVDTNSNLKGPLQDFDFIAFFSQDAEFKAAWSHYQFLEEVSEKKPENGSGDKPSRYRVYVRQ